MTNSTIVFDVSEAQACEVISEVDAHPTEFKSAQEQLVEILAGGGGLLFQSQGQTEFVQRMGCLGRKIDGVSYGIFAAVWLAAAYEASVNGKCLIRCVESSGAFVAVPCGADGAILATRILESITYSS